MIGTVAPNAAASERPKIALERSLMVCLGKSVFGDFQLFKRQNVSKRPTPLKPSKVAHCSHLSPPNHSTPVIRPKTLSTTAEGMRLRRARKPRKLLGTV